MAAAAATRGRLGAQRDEATGVILWRSSQVVSMDADDADLVARAVAMDRAKNRNRATTSTRGHKGPNGRHASAVASRKRVVVGRRKSSFDDLSRTLNGASRARAMRTFASDDEDERSKVGELLPKRRGGVDGEDDENNAGGCETVDDARRKYALEQRLKKMRALPRTSRYARQQCELIEKALDILNLAKRYGTRSVEEEDELAGLLKAVKL